MTYDVTIRGESEETTYTVHGLDRKGAIKEAMDLYPWVIEEISIEYVD